MTQLTRAMSSPSKMRKIQSSPTRRIRNFWQRDAHTEDKNMGSRETLKWLTKNNTLSIDLDCDQIRPLPSDLSYIVGAHRYVNERYGLIKKKSSQCERDLIFIHLQCEVQRQNKGCYKFQRYTWNSNFELGQLKEASLDSFFPDCGRCQSLEFT